MFEEHRRRAASGTRPSIIESGLTYACGSERGRDTSPGEEIFLQKFVDDGVPWAHVDLAGTSVDEATKSATGYGVRLIVDYLRRRSGAAATGL